MESFNNLSVKLLNRRQENRFLPEPNAKMEPAKWWLGAVLLFSFLGFLDSIYLAAEHYFNFPVTCAIVQGCEQVLNSSYAAVFGVPTALIGAFYYLTIFLAVIAFIDRKKFFFLKVAVILPISGFFFTIWLIVIQLFFLGAFCFYCLLSALFTTILFSLSLFMIFRRLR